MDQGLSRLVHQAMKNRLIRTDRLVRSAIRTAWKDQGLSRLGPSAHKKSTHTYRHADMISLIRTELKDLTQRTMDCPDWSHQYMKNDPYVLIG